MRAWRALTLLTAVSLAGAGCGSGGSAGPRTATRTHTVASAVTTTTPAGASATTGPTGTAPTTVPAHAPATSPPRTVPYVPRHARVRVAVAGLWHTASSARALDQKALGAPVDIRGWLAGMTTAQRESLTDRLDTQLLLGDDVLVVGEQDGWANVRVPSQPHPADSRGYPGWLPLPQLTFDAAVPATTEATVVALTTWLVDPADGHRVMEVSIGTRLPVRATTSSAVDVTTPDGTPLRVPAGDVSVTARGAPALPATADDVVRVARLFEGMAYLWGGVSGFGVDCSGLTWIDYRLHGVTIPRDSVAQAAGGAPVARGALRPGDLVFFATKGTVHHNGMVVGDGVMIHSPHTGTAVQLARFDQGTFAAQYQGARRYLG